MFAASHGTTVPLRISHPSRGRVEPDSNQRVFSTQEYGSGSTQKLTEQSKMSNLLAHDEESVAAILPNETPFSESCLRGRFATLAAGVTEEKGDGLPCFPGAIYG
jgi:hypothetical protein